MNSYACETIARQRMDEIARQARTAHQRHQIKVRAGWHFPKVTFPTRRRAWVARPA